MNLKTSILLLVILFISTLHVGAQQTQESLLTLDRIYNSDEFKVDSQRPISWTNDGEARSNRYPIRGNDLDSRVPGNAVQHYIPAMQWVDEDLLLIQQLNRKQNTLNVFAYRPSSGDLEKIYTETEDTWVDLTYPDIASNHWAGNDLPLVEDGSAFLRMTESDGWRHLYKVDITS
ncbi:MAG: DPP IV N-terminal domain-containing protein [Pricia sp.]